MWRATLKICEVLECDIEISIHALRVESDPITLLQAKGIMISIHALRVESDLPSTAATKTAEDFNPRSPCGERPDPFYADDGVYSISIHALRVESDFLTDTRRLDKHISIHALRVESDIFAMLL